MDRLLSPARRLIKGLFAFGLVALLAYFCWRMVLITLQYWPIQEDVAFLRIKQAYIEIFHWKAAFFLHVFTSTFALLAGFTQFWPVGKLGRWHRWLGRAYAYNIIFLTGPASLLMGFYANGGVISRVAFVLLALLWIGTTAAGVQAILQGRRQEHRDWMIRSYALTLSAVTLRLWKMGLALTIAPNPMDLYRIVAWLGWIPNLLLAEWWIRSRRPRSLPASS